MTICRSERAASIRCAEPLVPMTSVTLSAPCPASNPGTIARSPPCTPQGAPFLRKTRTSRTCGLGLPLVQVAGMRPLRRSPLSSLRRRRNPRTAPDHEAVAQGDRRKTRRSSKWEIEQSSPRRKRTWRSTSTGTAAATPSSPCSSTASSRATAPRARTATC